MHSWEPRKVPPPTTEIPPGTLDELTFFLISDLSTGPTSLIGLLTAEIVKDLVKEGYQAQDVAAAVALGMGVYGMALGFLKLGFLLDFVSTPVLNGFISAAAIVIAL